MYLVIFEDLRVVQKESITAADKEQCLAGDIVLVRIENDCCYELNADGQWTDVPEEI
jgi:hypothetical protein